MATCSMRERLNRLATRASRRCLRSGSAGQKREVGAIAWMELRMQGEHGCK